jgi:cation diffusion facilitator family transporter
VVGFLILSATVIAYESIRNIRTPHKLPEPYTLVVLGAIIIIKEIFYRIVSKRAKESNSSSLKADAWHHRSDAITSVTAFIGISIALIFGPGYETADDWAALLASAIIFYNSYLIFRPALGEIMDEHLFEELVGEIRLKSKQIDGIIDTEKCHVRKAGMRYYVDLHIIVDGRITVEAGHNIAHALKDHLQETIPELADILIHVEPDGIVHG